MAGAKGEIVFTQPGLVGSIDFSSGARGNAKPKQCSTCEGRGWTTAQQATSHRERMHVVRQQCHDCKGVGERLKDKEK